MIADNAGSKFQSKTPNPPTSCRATRLRNLAVLEALFSILVHLCGLQVTNLNAQLSGEKKGRAILQPPQMGY